MPAMKALGGPGSTGDSGVCDFFLFLITVILRLLLDYRVGDSIVESPCMGS